MFIKFIQICLLCTVLSYKIRCPELSEIRLYSKKCKYPANYHCILKDDDKTYKEYCRKFEWVTAGNFPIIRGIREHIDYQKCPPERYQPKLVMSNDYYQCQFRKSGCSEEGQVKYNMAETTTNDTKCRCDYTRGYAFVEKPRNTCYCIPSEEDCSCYLNKCHKEQKLDTDYSCIAKLQKYNEKMCKPMLPIIDKVVDNSTDDWRNNADVSNIYISGSVTQEGKQIVWYIVIITVIGICFVGFVVGCCCTVITVPSMKDKNIDVDIKKHGKTSKEPGNVEVNFSSKEQCKDKHLQDMIVETLSTEAGTVSPKEDKYKTLPFAQVAAVSIETGTVSPKEDKYKTSVAQVGTVSIETASYSMHNLRDHSISDTYDKDQRNIPSDVDILIIHLERTNEITEVLKFKDHLKDLVTEMGYNNISIKLLEEEFHQEDGKDTVKLNDLFAKCGYIFVYISKHSVPTRMKRIELAESSFKYAIKHPKEYPQIKPVCDCENWHYLEGYPTYLNYYKYKQSIDIEEYKSKLSYLLETMILEREKK